MYYKIEADRSNFLGVMRIMDCAKIDSGCLPFSSELLAFMHRVDISAGDDWYITTLSGTTLSIPRGVRARCGYCNTLQTLKLSSPVYNSDSRSIVFKADCVNSQCRMVSTALLTEPSTSSGSEKGKEFWILPKPLVREAAVNDVFIAGDQATRIKRAYKSALKNFNDNDYSESIAASGRVVEAIGKTAFPKSKSVRNIGGLFYKLEDNISVNPDFKELIDPLVKLGKALALGRNPGGHFFLEAEPDQDLASKVLDLTEFLLTYIYVVADQGVEVASLIEACNPFVSSITDKELEEEST